MTLPPPSERYDRSQQAAVQDSLERELSRTLKRGEDVHFFPPVKLVLVSPNGSRWSVGVDNAGVLNTTAL